MTCEDAKKNIPLFLYGELSFTDEDEFEAHLDECRSCTTAVAREKVLHGALDGASASVSPELLRECRQHLRSAIEQARPPRTSFLDRLQELFAFRWHVPTVARPAGALALVAMGFFGARFVPQNGLGGFTSAGLTEPVASRVRYLEPEPSGKVQIVIEETRQKTLTGNVADEKIQRLLLTAAKDPGDPGLRVESMDLLKNRPETLEVRDALLYALQHDVNAGVRLKALEGLKGSAGDPQVRQALSRVLLGDKNPGVRTQVIDLLMQKEQPEMAGVLQELMRKEDNGYVRMRCQKALRDMKASVETF